MAKRIADFRPARRNANGHTARGMGALENSVQTDGWIGAMTTAADREMIAGSARVEIAASVFGTDVEPIVVESDGSRPIVVVRTDIPNADDPRAQRLALADNRVQEIDLAWDVSVLAEMDAETLGNLWTPEELSELGQQWADEQEPPGDPGAALDRAEKLKAKYEVDRGKIWECGRHRVGCGDSYDLEFLPRLIGAAKVDMLHTDPPYGINIVQPRNGESSADSGGAKPFTGGTSGTRRVTGAAERSARVAGRTSDYKLLPPGIASAERGHVQHGKPSKNQLTQSNLWPVMVGDNPQRAEPTEPVGSAHIVQSNLYPVIQGDDRPFSPEPLLNMAPIVILWGANYYADKLPSSSCWIVWDKREDITRNTFADCELAWCNLSKPARLFHHLWNGLHKGSQHGERRTHPTEKPVALFEQIGRMFCPEGIWLDVFAGTGAQVIAAERVGAQCLACDIEPLYVATILERWATMTGKTPVLVSE